MKKVIFGILLLLPIVSYGSETGITTIKEYMLDQSNGLKVYFKVNENLPADNSCRINPNWPYVIDISTEFGRYMFSSLMAAYAAKQQVKIYGAGTCNVHSEVETVYRIEFK